MMGSRKSKLIYEEAGSGPAVLLLHGFPLSRAIWEVQKRHLSDRYRVILADLPGHGASPVIPEITIAEMAREVLNLLDDLHIEAAAVAGHSMGGYVTLALEQLAPGRVAGLALVASQAGGDTPEARNGRYTLAEKVGREGPSAVVESMLPKLFASAGNVGAGETLVERLICSTSVEGIQGALMALAHREDLRPRLPSITVPTLVLAGEQDRLIPLERSEGMAAQVPNAVLVKVAGAGHMPMLEQPAAVNKALAEWLERVF